MRDSARVRGVAGLGLLLCCPSGWQDELPEWVTVETAAAEVRCDSRRGFFSLLDEGTADIRVLVRGPSPVLELQCLGHLIHLGAIPQEKERWSLVDVFRSLPPQEKDSLALAGVEGRPAKLRRQLRVEAGQRLLFRVADPQNGRAAAGWIDVINLEREAGIRPSLVAIVHSAVSSIAAAVDRLRPQDLPRARAVERLFPRSVFGDAACARFDPIFGISATRGQGLPEDVGVVLRSSTQLFVSRGLVGGVAPWLLSKTIAQTSFAARTLDLEEGTRFYLCCRWMDCERWLLGHVAQVLEDSAIDLNWSELLKEDVAGFRRVETTVVRSDGEPVPGAWVFAIPTGAAASKTAVRITCSRQDGRAALYLPDEVECFEAHALALGETAGAGTRTGRREQSASASEWPIVLEELGSASIVLEDARRPRSAMLRTGRVTLPILLMPDGELKVPATGGHAEILLSPEFIRPEKVSLETGARTEVSAKGSLLVHRVWLVDGESGAVVEGDVKISPEEGARVRRRDGHLLVWLGVEGQPLNASVEVEGFRPASVTLGSGSPPAIDLCLERAGGR